MNPRYPTDDCAAAEISWFGSGERPYCGGGVWSGTLRGESRGVGLARRIDGARNLSFDTIYTHSPSWRLLMHRLQMGCVWSHATLRFLHGFTVGQECP